MLSELLVGVDGEGFVEHIRKFRFRWIEVVRQFRKNKKDLSHYWQQQQWQQHAMETWSHWIFLMFAAAAVSGQGELKPKIVSGEVEVWLMGILMSCVSLNTFGLKKNKKS